MNNLRDISTDEAREEVESAVNEEESSEKKIRKPFAIWQVKGKEYKLVLTTNSIIELEEKFGSNLLNIVSDNVPSLKVMLIVTHSAMKKFNHGIKFNEVKEIYSKYVSEGGSQTDFMTEVFIPIYEVSGFFSQEQTEVIQNKMSDAQIN